MKLYNLCIGLMLVLFLGSCSRKTWNTGVSSSDDVDRRPFVIYDASGTELSYGHFLDGLNKQDVVLFGEYHDCSIVHWLQLVVVKDLAKHHKIILGAEMLERDNQEGVNLYLQDQIDLDSLHATTRLWNNFETDYLPLLDWAKEQDRPFYATNVPRRYASLLFKQGLDSLMRLGDEDKQWMAPLPFPYDGTLSSYAAMKDMMEGHGGDNFPMAQAIKDATMGYTITQAMEEGTLFIHFNGAYHSDDYQGIKWYIDTYSDRSYKVTTISTVYQNHVNKLEDEYNGKADYIICVPDDMTRTYR